MLTRRPAMEPARRASLWLLLAVAGFVRPLTPLPGDAALTRRPAMQPARRASLWLLLAVVATLLASAAAQRQRPAVCDITCCTTHPNCTDATSVTCDCLDEKQMRLESSFFPATIQNITIVRVKNIIIDADAMEQLDDLERLDIKHATNLKIQQHGLRLQTDSKLLEFRVSDVNLVTIHDSAFSGSWNGDTLVLMESISVLTVYEKAFDYNSSSLGPSLTFSRVRTLDLAPAAIVAPISRLFISNVRRTACLQNSIGGNVTRLMLNNVNINDAQSGCVRAGGDGMEQLSIHSCFFGSVQDRAFSGKINDVLISNTTMTSIHENGFQIQVDKLQINHTRIEELNANGLNVSAKNAILFNNVHVGSLKQHALLGLQVNRSSSGKPPSLSIQSLYIDQPPADGSLAFADCTPVRIEHLQVVHPRPQVCPTEQWTRRLVGASGTALLTMPQYQVYRQLVHDLPCTGDEHGLLTEGDVADQGCTPTGRAARWQDIFDQHPGLSIGLGLGGAALVMVTVGGLLVRRRLTRPSHVAARKTRSVESCDSGGDWPSQACSTHAKTTATRDTATAARDPTHCPPSDIYSEESCDSGGDWPSQACSTHAKTTATRDTATATRDPTHCPPSDIYSEESYDSGAWPSQASSKHAETAATRDTATAARDTAHCSPADIYDDTDGENIYEVTYGESIYDDTCGENIYDDIHMTTPTVITTPTSRR